MTVRVEVPVVGASRGSRRRCARSCGRPGRTAFVGLALAAFAVAQQAPLRVSEPLAPGPDAGVAAVGRNSWTSLRLLLGLEIALEAAPATSGEHAAEGSAQHAPGAHAAATPPAVRIVEVFADARSGVLSWVVIDVGRATRQQRTVVVPYSALRSSRVVGREPPRATLALPAARLAALPAFDLAATSSAELDAAVARHGAAWRALVDDPVSVRQTAVAHEASAPRGEVVPAAAPVPSLVAASELLSMRMRSNEGASFGDVALVLVEAQRGTIDFLVVARGGLLGFGAVDWLVPFGAASLTRAGADERWRLRLDRGTAQLAGGVRYAAPRDAWLEPANAHRAREFFGAVAAPATAPPRAAADAEGK
jgi:hypothetical protein